ncbi:MAG: DUF2203 domain-containing protein [Microcystaceae cyanobacterium]
MRERYDYSETVKTEREGLEEHRQDVESRWQESHLPELEQELEQVKEKLRDLGVSLESQLLSDSQLQDLFFKGLREGILGDLFWQILRLGGLGVGIGWLLKSWAG